MLITGAGGVLRPALVGRLGSDLAVVGRRDPRIPGARWIRADLTGPLELDDRYEAMLHAAPLWLLPRHIAAVAAAGVARIVAVGSTSVITKARSDDPAERRIAEKLNAAENDCADACRRHGVDLTVLRPTMIYGFGRDRNVASIARWIRRWRVVPVAGPGSGGRQPVHAGDVVAAMLATLGNPVTFGRTYTLSGADCLSYTEMVEAIFRALGRRPRVVHVPVGVVRLPLTAAHRLGMAARLTPGVASRMNEDQCFDHADAARDFAFRGSPFLTDPGRDLPK